MWLSNDHVNLVFKKLEELKQEIKNMAFDISKLKAAVTAETTVDQAVETLLTTLSAKIQALIDAGNNSVDPAELQAIVDQMTSNASTLGAAVAQNTPAAPAA